MTLYFILINDSQVDYICVADNLEEVKKEMTSRNIDLSEYEIREIWDIPEDFRPETYFHVVASEPIATADYIAYFRENIRDNFGLRYNNGMDPVDSIEMDGPLENLAETSDYLWEVYDPEVLEEFKEYLTVESPVYCTGSVATPMETCITFY